MVAEGSSLARRALGRQLNALREKAEINQAQAARILGISPQTMGRLEDGLSVRSASDLYMNTLCDRYQVSDEMRRLILDLAEEVRSTAKHGGGWWRAYADSVNGFDYRPALLNAAVRLTAWNVIILPEIIRTVNYWRAVTWTRYPHLPTDQIEERIDRSVRRQRCLDDPNFTVEILLSEAAIREEMGGLAVMNEQRRYLVEIGQRPNVTVRLVPFKARGHIGAVVGSFSLLRFPLLPQTKFVEPPIVYIEEYVGDLYLERSEEVRCYDAVLAELRRVALDENDSRRMLLGLACGG
ncbi:helix-turn-helix domain-containing protein [Nocardia sp. NPDC004068]|uniref:helix-turn-helix domain-containing protein n=1 Tax=Nocardia sp. NPDC004068 TaxID=3364303 RepID=UPI0036881023